MTTLGPNKGMSRTLVTIALSALIPVAVPTARAACSQDRGPDGLSAELDAAEQAFGDLDVEGFATSMDEAAFTVDCLDAVVTPQLAARYHRMLGVRLYAGRDEQRAVLAFAAARALEPKTLLPLSLVPEGHSVRELYGRFDLDTGTFTAVPPPAAGTLAFDGFRTLDRADAWPSLVQVVDEGGKVVASAYVFPGEALPDYRVDPRFYTVERRKKRTKVALLGTAAGTAVLSGFLYGVAASSAASFEQQHPEWDAEALRRHRARTNALVVASVGAAGVAVGTGVVGVLLVRP